MQDIPTFFNYHPQFSEQFQHVQEIFNLEKHQLLRFIEVRFLSIYPVVNRAIEQHKAVKKMFVEEIPNNHRNVAKQPRAVRIRTALKNKYTLPSLYFIRNTLEMFQKYEKLFQKSEVTIHLLYDKQIELYQTALMYLCPMDKIQNLKSADSLLSFDYNKAENVLPLNQMTIGTEAKKLISTFAESDRFVFLNGVKRFFIHICDELKQKLPLKNKVLANLRFLKPENRKTEGERMIVGCAKVMPPVAKLTSREMDALSLEWKHLVIQDLPEIPKIDNYVPVKEHWESIFEINDAGEPKYPLIKKVVHFSYSIAEANGEVEREFSQVLHILTKDRNNIDAHTLKGLLITKSYVHTIGSCLNFKMDQSMLANIKASHSKYNERLESNRKGTEGCVHKRIIEDAKETFRGDKKLRKIEMKKLEIAEQEKAISKKQAEAKLLVNQANTLMEETESMRTFLNKERNILEKAEKQIQTSIIKSSCQKANRKSLLPVDDNNNEVENDSS